MTLTSWPKPSSSQMLEGLEASSSQLRTFLEAFCPRSCLFPKNLYPRSDQHRGIKAQPHHPNGWQLWRAIPATCGISWGHDGNRGVLFSLPTLALPPPPQVVSPGAVPIEVALLNLHLKMLPRSWVSIPSPPNKSVLVHANNHITSSLFLTAP